MAIPQAGSTLHVRRTGIPGRVEILDGTTSVATAGVRTVRRGGRIEIDGQPYRLERTALAQQYRLSSEHGDPVATAARALSRGWDVEVGGGRVLCLSRSASAGREVLLDDGGHRVGEIRRVGRGADAELPGLDRPTQVFVLIVALAARERRRRAVLIGR